MKVHSKLAVATIFCLSLCRLAPADAQAQTAATGGWVGMGFLSSIPFLKLEPTKCTYRLARIDTLNAGEGNKRRSISYANSSNYTVETIPGYGYISSINFDVSASRLSDFAYAATGLRQREAQIQFFLKEVKALSDVSCEIAWEFESKQSGGDVARNVARSPILRCSGELELKFADGSTVNEPRSASLILGPEQLALQRDASCK